MHTDLYVILQFLQEHFLVLLIDADFLAVIDEVVVFVSWKLLGLLFTLGNSVKSSSEATCVLSSETKNFIDI